MALTATLHKDGTTSYSENGQVVYTKRITCRACKSIGLESVLDLGTQYLVNFVEEIDESLPKAPLHLVQCSECGLLQLEHTTNPDLLFRTFWYRSGINETMRRALSDIVEHAHQYHRKGTWLDIGANDGYLLTQVDPGFKRVACEPALTFADELKGLADTVVSDYFNANTEGIAGKKFEVITSAAMFYDVDDPAAFIRDIKSVLSDNGVWINQLNDSPTMVKANAFDAICHEHLCYYDLASLNKLYESCGLRIINVWYNDVNGGSMRVVAKHASGTITTVPVLDTPVPIFDKDIVTPDQAQAFANRVRKWRGRMLDYLNSETEPIWLYGASTKGAVLLQYLGEYKMFAGIADRNPFKHGLKMVGSWLPIYDEAVMRKAEPDTVMVLPWAFRDEFVKRERDLLDDGSVMVFPLPNIELVL